MGSFWRARAYYAITYDISFPNQSRNHWEFTRYVRRSELFESSAGAVLLAAAPVGSVIVPRKIRSGAGLTGISRNK